MSQQISAYGTEDIDEFAWLAYAACKDADFEAFFDAYRESEAFEYCRQCPVTAQCRVLADRTEPLNLAHMYGIYGGETAEQRYRRRTARWERVT